MIPLEPRHRGDGITHDVFSRTRGDGNKNAFRDADILQKRSVFFFDLAEAILAIAREIHFVHGHNNLPKIEQTEQLSVPAALLAHAFIRRDHYDRRIGIRCAGDHVLQEFLMAGRVDDDVVPPGAPKLNLRRIDRDVLLLLLGERIKHKGVFERFSARCARFAKAFDFALGQRIRVRQNPTDQRGLAVIDVADKDDL